MSSIVSRRKFLKAVALGAGTVGLAACASSAPVATEAPPAPTTAPAATEAPAPTEAPKPTEAPAAPAATEAPKATEAPAAPAPQFSESPAMTEQVNAGKLPPLAERLPNNPQVVTPLVTAGKYGGTLRQGIVGGSATWGGMLYTVQWENLVQWKPDFSDVEPSIAEKIDVSSDGKEFTFHLRQGMKWSDGEPFGPADILFLINDVMLNKELSPGGPGADWLPSSQKEGFGAEQVGENAVKIKFPNPYGTFLFQIATWGGRQFAQYPKHYLQQFHKTYNDKVDDLVKEDNTLKDWTGLFFKKGPDTWGNPDRFMDVVGYPSLGPWIVTQPLGAGTTVQYIRNPYYWKVDDKGNQLPYIDAITTTSYQDGETRTLAMLNGDLDFIKDPGEGNREVYFDAQAQGKAISIIARQPDGGNTVSVHFNRASKNEALRELFNQKDFRVGMSHAINRPEIIEVVFKGQGTPAQVSPLESSPLYHEKLSTQYIEYDTAKANELLDKVLPDKDADGMRLGKDGKRLSIVWTLLDANYTGGDAKAWIQASELMVGYFKAVGVETKLDVIADQVLTERRTTNDVDMFTFHGGEGGAGMSAIIDPRWHIPGEFWGMFGLGWYLDISATGDDRQYAVPMDDKLKGYRQAWEKATQATTTADQIAAMKTVLDNSAEEFWTIGISRPGMSYQPNSKRLQGLPDGALDGWLPGTHKLMRPEQWFINEA
jgi:peptide/nickel transport system substrate-binding protein